MATRRERTRRRLPTIPTRSESSTNDQELLKHLSPEILAQLKQSTSETTFPQGDSLKNVYKSEQESQGTTGKRLEISVVEGSFRRIAGIRELADTSGTFVLRIVEILREPGKSLGFYIQQGDGWKREDGVFVSRVNLGSIVETNGLLGIGDEIIKVNGIDVTRMSLANVAVVMRYVERLFLTVKVLTSPTPIRTYSMRVHKNRPHADSTSTAGTTRRTSSIQPSGSAPKAQRNNSPNNEEVEGVVPYAYTRIGMTNEPCMESPGYATVSHTTMPIVTLETGQEARGDQVSTDAAGNKQSEGVDVAAIDYDCNNQSMRTQPYCGVLQLVLDKIYDLIPLVDNAPVVCSIACDTDLTIEVPIPANTLEEGDMKIKQEYHIQLSQNHWITFSLVNGLLSSSKRLPLSYFIPNMQERTSEQCFTLTLDPIGRLKFTLRHIPLPAAIPRWANPTTPASTSSLKELVASNPSNSGLPPIIERSIQLIQEVGIETVGLYQIVASQAAKKEALSVCWSPTFHLSQLHSVGSQLTVHAFTGVLKDFFLNLPHPIFDADFTASLQDAVQLELSEKRSAEAIPLSSFIECLPHEIHTTTCALLSHLRSVCQHGSINKTTIDKISLLFAPLLFTPAHSDKECTEDINSGNFTLHAHILKELILNSK